jgi:hypothetical protein
MPRDVGPTVVPRVPIGQAAKHMPQDMQMRDVGRGLHATRPARRAPWASRLRRLGAGLLLLASLTPACHARRDECNEPLLSALRNKSFSAMTTEERRSYQTLRDECSKSRDVCADPTVSELFAKSVAEMSDDEYAVFQDVTKDCARVRPCSLSQCVELSGLPDSALTVNQLDFRNWCADACSDCLEHQQPTRRQIIRKRLWLSALILGIVAASVGVVVIVAAPRGPE